MPKVATYHQPFGMKGQEQHYSPSTKLEHKDQIFQHLMHHVLVADGMVFSFNSRALNDLQTCSVGPLNVYSNDYITWSSIVVAICKIIIIISQGRMQFQGLEVCILTILALQSINIYSFLIIYLYYYYFLFLAMNHEKLYFLLHLRLFLLKCLVFWNEK